MSPNEGPYTGMLRARDIKVSRSHYTDYQVAAEMLQNLGLDFTVSRISPPRCVDPRIEIRYTESPEIQRIGGFQAIHTLASLRQNAWEVENGPHARNSSHSGVPFQDWIKRADVQAERNMRAEAERIALQAYTPTVDDTLSLLK